MADLKNTMKTVCNWKNGEFRRLTFLMLAVLLSIVMVCGMLSGCGTDEDASDIRTSESDSEGNNATSDGTTDKIESGSNDAIGEQSLYPSGEGENSALGSNPADALGEGGGSTSNQTAVDDSTQSPPPPDSSLTDLRNLADQTLSSIEGINRMVSVMQQDIRALKTALNQQSHTTGVLRTIVLIQAVVILIVLGNTIGIIVMARNQADKIDEVDSDVLDLKKTQETQEKEMGEHLQGKINTLYDDIVKQIEGGIRKVQASLPPTQKPESTSPQKVYFNVMGGTDREHIRLEKTSSTAASFYALLNDKELPQYRYELYPAGYPNGTITKNALYIPSMKGCFDIVPSDMRGGSGSCRIGSCVEAIIERESGNVYRLVLKGQIQVV